LLPTEYSPGELNISWIGTSPIPQYVTIYDNEDMVYLGDWVSGVPFQYNFSSLVLGVHFLECIFNTTSGSWISDTVMVEIIEPMLTISQPDDFEYLYSEIYSSGDLNITWIGTSVIADQMVIYHNDVSIYTGEWINGASLVFSIPELVLGTHSYECVLNSTSGLWIADRVIVRILEPIPSLLPLADVNIFANNTNQTYSWLGYSPFAENVTILQNGEIIYQGEWISGEPIDLSIDGLEPGDYVFECILETSTGQTLTDTMVVVIADDIAIPVDNSDELAEMEGDYRKKMRILWTVIIVLGILFGASIGTITYYIRKQKDYIAYLDILQQTEDLKIRKVLEEKNLADGDIPKRGAHVTEADIYKETGGQVKFRIPRRVGSRVRLLFQKLKKDRPRMYATSSDHSLASGESDHTEYSATANDSRKSETQITHERLKAKTTAKNLEDKSKTESLGDKSKGVPLEKPHPLSMEEKELREEFRGKTEIIPPHKISRDFLIRPEKTIDQDSSYQSGPESSSQKTVGTEKNKSTKKTSKKSTKMSNKLSKKKSTRKTKQKPIKKTTKKTTKRS
ncbi:MAG: hypothetical protein ACTSYI_03815, partial [Promethearchaeota archaeon]